MWKASVPWWLSQLSIRLLISVQASISGLWVQAPELGSMLGMEPTKKRGDGNL